MTRALFISALTGALCAAGVAAADADWTVASADGACETRARLNGAPPGLALVVRATGEATKLEIPSSAAPGAVSLSIDGRRQPVTFQAADGRLEADLTPAVIGAIARGGSLRLRGAAPQPLTASLRGSGRAMDALRQCGERVRMAALAQQRQVQAQEDAAAAERARADAQARTAAEDAAALATAKKAADDDLVRQSREVLP